jgi:hypothetical protein
MSILIAPSPLKNRHACSSAGSHSPAFASSTSDLSELVDLHLSAFKGTPRKFSETHRFSAKRRLANDCFFAEASVDIDCTPLSLTTS